jgi:Domain of unknown function (DUF397)
MEGTVTGTGWRKSSYSAGNNACVEVAWCKASASVGNGACVEVGTMAKSTFSGATNCVEAGPCACGGDVLVRDTKDREGPVLRFTGAEWAAFLAGAKAGEFDHLA